MPSCDSDNPDLGMFTNLTSYIFSDEELLKRLEERYGGFFAGTLDTMDAAYYDDLQDNPNLTQADFIEKYITEGIDVRDTEDFLMQLMSNPEGEDKNEKELREKSIIELGILVEKLKQLKWGQ